MIDLQLEIDFDKLILTQNRPKEARRMPQPFLKDVLICGKDELLVLVLKGQMHLEVAGKIDEVMRVLAQNFEGPPPKQWKKLAIDISQVEVEEGDKEKDLRNLAFQVAEFAEVHTVNLSWDCLNNPNAYWVINQLSKDFQIDDGMGTHALTEPMFGARD